MDKSIAHHKNHGVGMMILVIMFTVSASLSAGGGGQLSVTHVEKGD